MEKLFSKLSKETQNSVPNLSNEKCKKCGAHQGLIIRDVYLCDHCGCSETNYKDSQLDSELIRVLEVFGFDKLKLKATEWKFPNQNKNELDKLDKVLQKISIYKQQIDEIKQHLNMLKTLLKNFPQNNPVYAEHS